MKPFHIYPLVLIFVCASLSYPAFASAADNQNVLSSEPISMTEAIRIAVAHKRL